MYECVENSMFAYLFILWIENNIQSLDKEIKFYIDRKDIG